MPCDLLSLACRLRVISPWLESIESNYCIAVECETRRSKGIENWEKVNKENATMFCSAIKHRNAACIQFGLHHANESKQLTTTNTHVALLSICLISCIHRHCA
jgi:hypothetical protein